MRDGNEVPRDDVASMFDDIAPVYDRLNTIMTFGLDNGWRRAAVEQTGIEPGASVADVACGTGKLTGELAERVGPFGKVIGIDLSGGMLALAEAEYRDLVQVEFRKGDALALPIDDDGVDAATIGFGMRNLANFEAGFRELARVVRPGGRVVCLELTMPRPALVGPPVPGDVPPNRPARRLAVRPTQGVPLPARVARGLSRRGPARPDDARRRPRRRVLPPPRAGNGRAPPRHRPEPQGRCSLAASGFVPDTRLVGRGQLRRRQLRCRLVGRGQLRRRLALGRSGGGSFPPGGPPGVLARQGDLVGPPRRRSRRRAERPPDTPGGAARPARSCPGRPRGPPRRAAPRARPPRRRGPLPRGPARAVGFRP